MIMCYTYVVHMKLAWLGVMTVGLTLLLAGCLGGGLYDCGSDVACFQEKAASCEPALITITNTTTLPGTGTMSMTMRAEIQGGTVEECTFYMKIEDISLSGGDLTPAEQQMFDAVLGIMEGKDMTCKVPATQLGGTTPSTGIADPDACTGSLIDTMEEMTGSFTP